MTRHANRPRLLLCSVALTTIACGPSGDSGSGHPPLDVEMIYTLRFGNPVAPSAAATSYAVEQALQVERRIADCMSSVGFEYAIPSPAEIRSRLGLDVPDSAIGDKESIGFGIATQASLQVGPTQSADISTSQSEDPAFAQNLFGDAGCYAQANVVNVRIDETLAPFEPLLSATWERYSSDSRIIAADIEWSQCMKAAGFDATTLDDLRSEVYRRLELVSSPKELTELQEFEIGAARSNAQCRGNLEHIYREVLDEIIALFDDRYRESILEALRSIQS